MKFKIGIDGGGTKTEGVLIDDAGTVVAIHVGAGCNPNILGAEKARSIVAAALDSLRAQATGLAAGGLTQTPFSTPPAIAATLLCMAGSGAIWKEFAEGLKGFGQVETTNDSRPILELATQGKPGVVLHAGTGSFVAARAPDGSVHYAGGLGWRFGDPGSGYDLGRRAIVRALLDLQGWKSASRLGSLLIEQTHLPDAASITRHFYHDPEVNQKIAALAPFVLRLAAEGDYAAKEIVAESVAELLDLATKVATKLFTASMLGSVRAGLSGPILTHPAVLEAINGLSPLPLTPIEGTPIEGVRRLLQRLG